MAEDPRDMLRRLCRALPETTERLSHGEPTWFVRGKKTFVMYADHHHDDRLALWCTAPPCCRTLGRLGSRAVLRPAVRGWPRLGRGDEIADLVADAYRTVAPKGLVSELDAGTS